jgi:hypothetical protein
MHRRSQLTDRSKNSRSIVVGKCCNLGNSCDITENYHTTDYKNATCLQVFLVKIFQCVQNIGLPNECYDKAHDECFLHGDDNPIPADAMCTV